MTWANVYFWVNYPFYYILFLNNKIVSVYLNGIFNFHVNKMQCSTSNFRKWGRIHGRAQVKLGCRDCVHGRARCTRDQQQSEQDHVQ